MAAVEPPRNMKNVVVQVVDTPLGGPYLIGVSDVFGYWVSK
jgi:hypothetical protein